MWCFSGIIFKFDQAMRRMVLTRYNISKLIYARKSGKFVNTSVSVPPWSISLYMNLSMKGNTVSPTRKVEEKFNNILLKKCVKRKWSIDFLLWSVEFEEAYWTERAWHTYIETIRTGKQLTYLHWSSVSCNLYQNYPSNRCLQFPVLAAAAIIIIV